MNMSVLCVLSDMTRGGSCGGGGSVRGVWWGGGASGSSRGFRLQSRRIVHYAAVPSVFFPSLFLSFLLLLSLARCVMTINKAGERVVV